MDFNIVQSTAKDAIAFVNTKDLTLAELQDLRGLEADTANRTTVLAAIDAKISSLPPPSVVLPAVKTDASSVTSENIMPAKPENTDVLLPDTELSVLRDRWTRVAIIDGKQSKVKCQIEFKNLSPDTDLELVLTSGGSKVKFDRAVSNLYLHPGQSAIRVFETDRFILIAGRGVSGRSRIRVKAVSKV